MLLRYFMEHKGVALNKEQLLMACWGSAYLESDQYLRVAINDLRKLLEPDVERYTIIITITYTGYMMAAL
jgi:DNA-binding response OmpR family regulator